MLGCGGSWLREKRLSSGGDPRRRSDRVTGGYIMEPSLMRMADRSR